MCKAATESVPCSSSPFPGESRRGTSSGESHLFRAPFHSSYLPAGKGTQLKLAEAEAKPPEALFLGKNKLGVSGSIYNPFSLAVVLFCQVTVNTELVNMESNTKLANTESLLLGRIQARVLQASGHILPADQ